MNAATRSKYIEECIEQQLQVNGKIISTEELKKRQLWTIESPKKSEAESKPMVSGLQGQGNQV